jgi:hypothetical protein
MCNFYIGKVLCYTVSRSRLYVCLLQCNLNVPDNTTIKSNRVYYNTHDKFTFIITVTGNTLLS